MSELRQTDTTQKAMALSLQGLAVMVNDRTFGWSLIRWVAINLEPDEMSKYFFKDSPSAQPTLH